MAPKKPKKKRQKGPKFNEKQLKFIVGCYSKGYGDVETFRAFTREFGNSHWLRQLGKRPHKFKEAYDNVIKKGAQHGNVVSKLKGKKKPNQTKVDAVKNYFEEHPEKSIRKASRAIKIPKSTVCIKHLKRYQLISLNILITWEICYVVIYN